MLFQKAQAFTVPTAQRVPDVGAFHNPVGNHSRPHILLRQDPEEPGNHYYNITLKIHCFVMSCQFFLCIFQICV